jgi:hypothetical protein
MATVYDNKKDIAVSIHGRKAGIDHSDQLVGPNGVRSVVELSTAPEALRTYGVSVMSGSTNGIWTLGAPPGIGARKTIVNASSASTATLSVVRSSSGSGVTFGGSTNAGGVRINLLNLGSAVELVAVTTAHWAPISMASSLFMTVSTSS